MAFVYHRVPSEMVGDVIYPLNQLAAIAPECYELQRSKYLGREAVLAARISQDGLLFNDTVHCAPLHPNRLFAARERLGLHPPRADASRARNTSRFSGLFFEIRSTASPLSGFSGTAGRRHGSMDSRTRTSHSLPRSRSSSRSMRHATGNSLT